MGQGHQGLSYAEGSFHRKADRAKRMPEAEACEVANAFDGEVLDLPPRETMADEVSELATLLRFLCDEDQRCLRCIEATIDRIAHAHEQAPERCDEQGFEPWLCPGCRDALNSQIDTQYERIVRVHKLARAKTELDVHPEQREFREQLYNLARCAYNCGGVRWHKVLHVLRFGLGFYDPAVTSSDDLDLSNPDVRELFDRLRKF